MNRYFLVCVFLLSSFTLKAAEKTLGAGILLGEPFTLTAKKFLKETEAIDAGLGFGFSGFVSIQADYLWHFRNFIDKPTEFSRDLALYAGVGPMILFAKSSAKAERRTFTDNGSSSAAFAIRIPMGIEWRPKDPPIGVFLEMAPAIGIVPGFVILHGGVGARLFFG